MLQARSKAARLLAAPLLAFTMLVPAAVPVAAADPVVLRVGTVQDLDATNPYQTALVVGYEVFQLTYNLLTDFGPNLEPTPGFAESFTREADGVTFKIRPDMKWSDGTPATAEDACFSWQLGLDAIANETNVGLGYLDPALTDAGVTKVECPDATTMKVFTTDTSDRVFQVYMPIIPKHIWGKFDYKTIADEKFDAPLVGTGPYTLAEWKTGEYARFVRNPNYWGTQGFQDEVVIQFFKGADTMVQALKAGEIDYARDANADQQKQLATEAGITTVAGTSNGWTQLAFNAYGQGTGKTIEGGGPSTKALLDPAFRDALGYAVDRQMLLDKVWGGFGEVGTTNVPPVLTQWHVEPDKLRTFDIELAKQKLDAAGYKLDGESRIDKEGKPITLRLYMPDSDENYPKIAQFVQDWYGQLGIKVVTQVYDSATLTDLLLPPEAGGEGNKADYDIELWGWSGNPDPNALLQVFRCDAIGSSSDSNWCDPEYDKMYDAQTAAKTAEERKAILSQMQNLVYDQAVYDILAYDASLHAYRTDRFAGWANQPSNGTPLFTYSTLGYTRLTDAAAVVATPSPEPSAAAPSAGASAAATAAPEPTPDTSGGTSSGGDTTTLMIVAVIAIVVLVVGGVLVARRRTKGPAADDE